MTDLDIAALRAVSDAATQEEWEAETWAHQFIDDLTFGRVLTVSGEEIWDSSGRNTVASAANATHIATFDPPTIRALLDRIEHLEAIVAAATEVLSDWEVRQEANRRILTSGALGHFQSIDCTGDLRRALNGDREATVTQDAEGVGA